MSFLSPSYKKIVAKAPPQFGVLMAELDPLIEANLREAGLPEIGMQGSRNVLYAEALATFSRITGTVSPECLKLATVWGQNAVNIYPNLYKPMLGVMARLVNTAVEEKLGVIPSWDEGRSV